MGTKINAIICPNCGKLVNANAEECIHCGFKNPGKKGLDSIFNIFNKDFISLISYFCVGLFSISIILDPNHALRQPGIFNFLSPSGEVLDKLGMTGVVAMFQGRWWTLITAIYLHGSLLHILFNVLWIRQLGPYVEEIFGHSRLIIIFTLSGVLGFIASNFAFIFSKYLLIKYTIGASGSIFGLLGALVYYGKNRGGVFGAAIFRQFLGWAILLFIFGFMMSGVNNFAHAGGFTGGYLAANVLGYNEIKTETILHKNLAAATIILTIICFVLALLKA